MNTDFSLKKKTERKEFSANFEEFNMAAAAACAMDLLILVYATFSRPR
jgi:hypothetical protein